MRRNNDLGGQPAGPIETSDVPVFPWQYRLDAMRNVLGDQTRRLVSLHEMRRAMEDLPPDQYLNLGFFERRVLAIQAILVEKGVLSEEEVDAETERVLSEDENADASRS